MEPFIRRQEHRPVRRDDHVHLLTGMEPAAERQEHPGRCDADVRADHAAAMEPAIERPERIGVTVLDGQLVVAAMEPAVGRREYDSVLDGGHLQRAAAMEPALIGGSVRICMESLHCQ